MNLEKEFKNITGVMGDVSDILVMNIKDAKRLMCRVKVPAVVEVPKYKKLVTEIYAEFMTEKLDDVERLFLKHAGREREVHDEVRLKYCPHLPATS